MIKPETVIAANRFGFGAKPGELAHIGANPRDWLRAQIRVSEIPAKLAALPKAKQILAEFQAFQQRRRELRDAEKAGGTAGAEAKAALDKMRLSLAPLFREQAELRTRIAGQTDHSFYERLVQFWTNHFAISADKPPSLALAGALENEAIRPYVNGRFKDMLFAVEKHPGMLIYLDNFVSVGPNSKLAKSKNNRRIGINENLGREILELHTLGVNGGYTQEDVTTFARAITGWSVGGGRGWLQTGPPGEFHFRADIHEPGSKTVLGKSYAQDGMAQGEAVLDDLCRHPSTARYVAQKLARHFIADEPPAAAVEAIARAFLQSDGDLPTVYEALIDAPSAWEQPLQKYKTPNDYIISAFRAYGTFGKKTSLLRPLEALGQRPYTPGSPAGWPDTARDWDGANALLKRIEFAVNAGKRIGSRADPLTVAEHALGPVLHGQTRSEISRAASIGQAHALVLASPEFLRR